MSQYNLNRIFNPRHVAVVGASTKTGTIGNALMKNLLDGRFSGTVLPVNPKYKTIKGKECFDSVSALEMVAPVERGAPTCLVPQLTKTL